MNEKLEKQIEYFKDHVLTTILDTDQCQDI